MASSSTATKTKRASKSRGAAKTAGKAPKAARADASSRMGAADITNYTAAMRWLYEHVDYERMRVVPYNERSFNLDRMRRLLDGLGAPHEQIKTVHVVGTKGKGSTCAMLTSMLQSCGYVVGQYTSPHLTDLRERITINNEWISHSEVAELFRQIAELEPKFGKQGLSYFEILTAAGFKYFADQAVDIAVIETGLGGRLDCTNVITPLTVGVTSISLDHTNILGDTLDSIAKEKAGVFKPDVAAISVAQQDNVVAVLQESAQTSRTPLQFTGEQIDFSYRFEASRELGPHTRVCLMTETSRFEHLAVPLRGEHQAHNCGLALALLDKLKAHGFHLPEDKVIAGLSKTTLAGRMDQVWDQPRVVLDGAHNQASLTALIRSLGAHIAYDSMVMIFGCGQDKDLEGMLGQIALGADKIIFTRAKSNPRAAEPEDLLHKFAELSGKMAQTAPSLEEALKLAARAVSREDLIVITGSFYLAGEAKKYFNDRKARGPKQTAKR